MISATLLSFATVSDSLAGTTKKLQKQALLADYFKTLGDDDLRLAVRFSDGRAFPVTDERVLAVGGSIVSSVILSLLHLDARDYHDRVVRAGEIGEALSDMWPAPGNGIATASPLTLGELAIAFEDLAATGHVETKRSMLRELFSRCVHPREAVYLAKIIFGDLRTGVQEGVLQGAVAKAFDKPLAEIQRTQLLVGDLEEVALLSRRDALGSARFQLFHPIQFMLATPQETAQDAAGTLAGRPFFAEDKLDGIRAQVHKSAGRIAIYTRTMDRADNSFPDVVDQFRRIPGEFLLDGEIVPYEDGQVLPFAHIQRRLGRKSLTPKILKANPARFIAFDILYRNGELLMDRPLRERRAALEELCKGCESMLFTQVAQVSTADEIQSAFDAARDRRNEGIVLKDPESIYSPGRRGQLWFKLKTHLPTFDCVVTAAEFGHGKRRNSLSDYTFAVWSDEPEVPGAKLVNIGKAYSGVTDEEIAQLTELFQRISVQRFGHVHLVEPRVVLEIACDQIQKSARHASGYALRFPRIKRIRWDKRPQEADRLSRIVEIFQSSPNFARRQGEAETPSQTQAEPTLFDHLA